MKGMIKGNFNLTGGKLKVKVDEMLRHFLFCFSQRDLLTFYLSWTLITFETHGNLKSTDVSRTRRPRWWARDLAEPDAGDNQGPAETVDRTRIGTGPTPTLTARQGKQE